MDDIMWGRVALAILIPGAYFAYALWSAKRHE